MTVILDLLLFGTGADVVAQCEWGKFEEQTALFPFVKGKAIDSVLTAIRIDTAARDLLVS